LKIKYKKYSEKYETIIKNLSTYVIYIQSIKKVIVFLLSTSIRNKFQYKSKALGANIYPFLGFIPPLKISNMTLKCMERFPL